MPEQLEHLVWVAEEFSICLSKALEGMTGEQFSVKKIDDSSGSPPKEKAFWWQQPFSAPVGSVAYIGASQAAVAMLGTRLLEAIGLEADAASVKSTYTETLVQALSGLAQSITARLRQEVTCAEGRQADPPASTSTDALQFRIQHPAGFEESFLVCFSPEFLSAIAPIAESAVKTPAQRLEPRTMDLLLDVELPVSVSFGRAELPLKDVIKLTTGSIVELNRSVSEPVEVIVNNCVIARGQVVVIEGNYGVRIDQIISRQERLRTLR